MDKIILGLVIVLILLLVFRSMKSERLVQPIMVANATRGLNTTVNNEGFDKSMNILNDIEHMKLNDVASDLYRN